MQNTSVCVYCKANYNIKNPKTLLMIRITEYSKNKSISLITQHSPY